MPFRVVHRYLGRIVEVDEEDAGQFLRWINAVEFRVFPKSLWRHLDEADAAARRVVEDWLDSGRDTGPGLLRIRPLRERVVVGLLPEDLERLRNLIREALARR